ncbi:hypothetical protein [Streptomyces sp. NBC_01092]|uniref:hypothetical protein n=1 Tax=Streptomyces sp. NBC_01092 TaxID=2903748 RepID=UPI003863B56B|nr:hypothetical protein OG254_38120 [Streptomyces sp. NBC_01092]
MGAGSNPSDKANSTPYDGLTAALEVHGFYESERERGRWDCPRHNGQRPALSVKDAGDGTALLYCFACMDGKPKDEQDKARAEIVKAVGLSLADLSWPAEDDGEPQPGQVPDWATREIPGINAPGEHAFVYTDEAGETLYAAVRTQLADGTKKFTQKGPGGVPSIEGIRRVLWKLPDVIEAVKAGRTVHLAEGEKAAGALIASGETATCNSGGSGGWRDELADSLKGAAEVIVWQDRDDKGAQWTAAVTKSLEARGIPRTVVQSRTTNPRDDAWDHLAAGYAVAQAKAVKAAEPTELEVFAPDVSPVVREMAERMLAQKAAQRLVSQWEASQRASTTMTVSQALDAVLSGQAAVLPTVARLEGGETSGGLFYPGLVNGVYGDASVGKSVIQAEVEARTLADGGIVVHWEFDNNPVMVIVSRLLHAGAKPEDIRGRFHVLYSTLDRDALTDDVQRAVKLVTLDALNPAVTSLGGDPYHPGGIDNAVREFFAPFTLHGACGVFVDHVGHESKDRQAGSIRKAQAVQGALYECQFEAPLKPGLTGRTRLILRKDNQGALGDRVGKAVATAVMTSEAEKDAPAGPVRTVFVPQDPFVPEEGDEKKWTDEERIEWAIRKMDEAGVPTGRGINATHEWMDGEGVKIPLRQALKNRAIKARNHRAEKASGTDTGEGPTGPSPLRVSGAIPSDTR